MAERLPTRTAEADTAIPGTQPDSDETLSRRSFVKYLGAGLLITVTSPVTQGQQDRRRGRGRRSSSLRIEARLHINTDGTVTVMTGKVEEGQGSRAQLTQAVLAMGGFRFVHVHLLAMARVLR